MSDTFEFIDAEYAVYLSQNLKGASSAMSDWMGRVPERLPAGRTQRVDDEQGRAGRAGLIRLVARGVPGSASSFAAPPS